MPNGPELWAAILAKMPPGSIIAGGAVRDWFLGVEPKDIDIFMSTKAALQPEEGVEIIAYDPRCGFSHIEVECERIAEYTALTNIALVSRGTSCGWLCDVVVIDGELVPSELIAGFDFGITRSWFDGQVHDTPEAAHDRTTATVTLLLNDRPERSIARFNRFNERHGGSYHFDTRALAELADALAKVSK